MLIVTAGIIKKGNKILITQRKDEKNQALKWEFPGGKLEEDETPKECLRREIMEELDIKIEIEDIYEVVYHKYENVTILLLCYMAKYILGNPRAIECNDFKWIEIEELKDYDLAEADKKIRNKLLGSGLNN
ncbi:(deoxy)nucleoside triphosphate pyrophosphohydrolase [Thermohalobacter berrensis]|uniref:8-oxo-dGTP diphosphatase n=1 Tax=Thermohalobacter berrensis TaxID=99594 RepID=A0A419SZG8_9FIRM|nr:(deoxy)nucleoside triphosphate pyrophosphohydrolase [Thermohalobacter berrensis]RKD30558.1 hypothetical protein BET03_04265 [Thermohalobacter berrensis]